MNRPYAPYSSPFRPGSEEQFQKMTQRRELRSRGIGIGMALVGMVVLPFIASTLGYRIVQSAGLVDTVKYHVDYLYMKPEVYYIYYSLLYLCMVLLPFMILIPVYHMKGREVCPLSRKIPMSTLLLAGAGGMAVCMVANTITNGWCTVLEGVFGIVSVPGELPLDASVGSRILYFCIFAILPPIAEELAFRGVVFGLLRPYGKAVAVVGSAFVFGIMHGNLLQIPFAFLGGLFFGYIVAETDSILPAVFLHFLNNALSVVQEFLFTDLNETAANHLVYILFILSVAVGCGCLVILMRRNKNLFRMEEDRPMVLTNKEQFRAFAVNPAMIAAYVVIGLEMLVAMNFAG